MDLLREFRHPTTNEYDYTCDEMLHELAAATASIIWNFANIDVQKQNELLAQFTVSMHQQLAEYDADL